MARSALSPQPSAPGNLSSASQIRPKYHESFQQHESLIAFREIARSLVDLIPLPLHAIQRLWQQTPLPSPQAATIAATSALFSGVS